MEIISEQAVERGILRRIRHNSAATGTEMIFALFTPPGNAKNVPVLFYLSGLTCNDTNFCTKSGAFSHAANEGIAIVAPATSPRGDIPGNGDDWTIGTGAGFYVDATETPYSKNYKMYTYVTSELPSLLAEKFPSLSTTAHGITGPSAMEKIQRH